MHTIQERFEETRSSSDAYHNNKSHRRSLFSLPMLQVMIARYNTIGRSRPQQACVGGGDCLKILFLRVLYCLFLAILVQKGLGGRAEAIEAKVVCPWLGTTYSGW